MLFAKDSKERERPEEGYEGGFAGAAAGSAYINAGLKGTGVNVDMAYSYNEGFSGSLGWGMIDQ